MSDVLIGGATVFPSAGARIAPSKVRGGQVPYTLVTPLILWSRPLRVTLHTGTTCLSQEKVTTLLAMLAVRF